MNICVHYTTQLRAALKRSEDSVDLAPNGTLDDLLVQLAQTHADQFRRLVYNDAGELLPNVILTVGNQQVRDLRHELNDGDIVTVLSAISGG